MPAPLRPTALEVDLDAAADNLRAVRGLVGPSRSIFAVVKADGYGFGAAEMGAVFARSGANSLPAAAGAPRCLMGSGLTFRHFPRRR